MEGLTILSDQLRNLPYEIHTRCVAEANFLFPIVVRVQQRVVLAVVFPAEDLLDKVHAGVDFFTGDVGLGLGVAHVCILGGGFCRHDEVYCFLLVF